MSPVISERFFRRALIATAMGGLIFGLLAWAFGRSDIANWIWATGTAPVVLGLLISMVRDLLAGRMGVDAIAFVSMSAALLLGENLAGIVVAVMYAGGNALEDFAISRAERDLKSLIDRAPRIAHRREGSSIADVPIERVSVGDTILVRAGEVIPIDGIIIGSSAMIDEAVLTGEPIPVSRREGEAARSGTVNAGETFEIRATATAGESTYAGIVRLVNSAQTAKAPFIRLADRFALLLLPLTLMVAAGAWLFSGDPIRGLAVLVAATPCPLILAAPVAFIAGVAQAARLGILIKGGKPFEALSCAHTVMFDKTGTLTVGGARLVAIETAPGQRPEDILRIAGSLEQASQHVVAAAIVQAARGKGLELNIPTDVRETMGSGLEGLVDGQRIRVGSHQLVYGTRKPEEWATRALRRAAWRSALSVFVAVDGRTIGALLLGDELRRETPHAVQALRSVGISRIIMLTGDRADAAETIAAALDLDAVLADRTPSDKVDAVASEQRRHPTVMVGDGINDAPALAASSVGIAMGARGASASSEAADVVILVDRLDRVSDAVAIAKRTHRIALQSVIAGLAMSGVAMCFAAVGCVGVDFIGSVIAENQRAAKAALDRFEEAARKLSLHTSKRQISATLADSASSFAKLASCCDLSLIAQSGPDSYGANDLAIEGALFRSGRPAIVVPYIHKLPISLKRTICCWDGSPSAARAVADSVPLLKKADRVELLIVVTEKIKDDEIIGADMAEHLARLGLNVTLQRINAADIDVGNAILSHVADSGSDFLVMGGYGHSRLREFVLGGATRTILSSMTLPVLLSH